MNILKFKRDDITVKLQVESQEDWDARSTSEQNEILDEAFGLATKKNFEKCDACGESSSTTVPRCGNCGVHKSAARKAAVDKVQPSPLTLRKDMTTETQSNETPEEKITKAATSFMKSSSGLHDAALELFNVGLDVFKQANPGKTINDFCSTAGGASLKERFDTSRTVLQKGPVEAYTKALDDEAATLAADIAKQVEAFSIAHNANPIDAKRRLRDISPSFAALEKRQAQIPDEHREAVAKCTRFASDWRQAEIAKSKRADAADAAAQMEKRRTKSMTPSERKFDDRVGEIMKERKLERPAATVWATTNDPVAKSLYEVSREERANGARS